MLDFCYYLRNESVIVKDQLVECWIEDMKAFVELKTGGEKTLPLDDEIEFYEYLFDFIKDDIKGL